jgi:hypothetical protein
MRARRVREMCLAVTTGWTVFVDRLGKARADLGVINGALNGFEIKKRPRHAGSGGQLGMYTRILDYLTLVVSECHLKAVRRAVPRWCGLIYAREVHGRVMLCHQRPSRRNPKVDGTGVAELLWREEAYETLRRINLAGGCSRLARPNMCRRLGENVPLDSLCEAVRETIKLRDEWRPDAIRPQSGEAA